MDTADSAHSVCTFKGSQSLTIDFEFRSCIKVRGVSRNKIIYGRDNGRALRPSNGLNIFNFYCYNSQMLDFSGCAMCIVLNMIFGHAAACQGGALSMYLYQKNSKKPDVNC